jgi:hypothetical protein
MCLALLLIRSRYETRNGWAVRALFLFPAFSLLGGGLGLQRFLFHTTTGWDFARLALGVSTALALLVWAASLVARAVLRHWEWRLELVVILSFLQLILAMFLPMLVVGLKVDQTQWKVEFVPTVLALSGFSMVVALGFLLKRLMGVRAQ